MILTIIILALIILSIIFQSLAIRNNREWQKELEERISKLEEYNNNLPESVIEKMADKLEMVEIDPAWKFDRK